jgi:hypothetical protein
MCQGFLGLIKLHQAPCQRLSGGIIVRPDR